MTQKRILTVTIAEPGTPWGSGNIWAWVHQDLKPEEKTVRGGLVRAIHAQHTDDTSGEDDTWTSLCDNGEPFWKEATRWVVRRWAYASAMASGYIHSRAGVINHVNVIMSPAHNGTLKHRADSDILLYEFNDGSWAAFKRAPLVSEEVDGVSISLHLDLYSQLSEKPEALRNGSFLDKPEVVAVDPVKAVEKAEAAAHEAEAPASVLSSAMTDFPWEISFKGASGEEPAAKGSPALPDPFEFSIPEEDPAPAEAAPSPTMDAMVQISCSNSKCKSNIITSIHNWPPALEECKLCNEGTTVAYPCGHRTKFNAWLLPQRPRFPAKWPCEACGHDDILHGGGTPADLSCTSCDCESFEVASLGSGSECSACGYKVPWNCTLPGVENVCDKCNTSGTLRVFGKSKEPTHAPVSRVRKRRGRPMSSKTFDQVEKRRAVKKQRSNCIECKKPILAGSDFREIKKRKVHEGCLGSNLTK